MDYINGPDQVIPCDNLTTTKPDSVVKIRDSDHPLDKTWKPISVPGLLHKIAVNYGNHDAMVTQDETGKFTVYTYKDYEDHVRICAKAFLKLGLERFHSVCILGFNSPEWFISDIAAIYAGGIATGIYITNSSEACHNIAHDSRANIIVVEDDNQLQKILEIRSRLPHLKAIVQYSGKPKHDDVLSWEQLMTLGREQSDEELENVLKTIAVNQCCTLVYTSGTVGTPKGVMLTHDSITFDAQRLAESINATIGSEVVVSYLPLSHIAAQVVDIYLLMTVAGKIHFAFKDALKGSLVNTLLVARPTRFLGVPRVWEKIREKMLQVGNANGFLKKALASLAKSYGLQHNMDKINGIKSNSWGYYWANTIVFRKIKQALGFDRCITFASAAAPLSPEIKKYFLSIDIPIFEAFGMSECGAHTMGTPDTLHLEALGCSLKGTKTKIDNPDENGIGEICMYGRHVFMGYLHEPHKTMEAIDDEGWLHSGDLGKTDEKDLVYITGRIKEILITAGGENIAPVPIEQLILNEMPYVSNAIVIGDKCKFLSVLLTLKTEIELETQIPLDNVTKLVEDWLRQNGSLATSVTEVLDEGPHPKILEAVQKSLDKINEKAISNAQRIQKFAFLPRDFSIATGELGPTLKIRRGVIIKMNKDIIDEFYR